MGMTHSSSGKRGFSFHKRPTSYTFERSKLKSVLETEEIYRLYSDEFQNKYSESDRCDHFADVTTEIQIRALKENGIEEKDINEALVALRNVRFDYSNDPEISNYSVYMRLDHCFEGSLKVGSYATDVELCTLEGKSILFSEWKKLNQSETNRPLVVFGGSAT